MAYPIDDLQKFAESWLAMGDSHTDWQIGETMAEVLRERLMELETQEATGAATEETVGRLTLVRKLLSGLTQETQVWPSGQREHRAVCPAAGDRALPHLQRAVPDRLWPTPNHDPFALESSFTLSSTDLRRFRYRGIEAYV